MQMRVQVGKDKEEETTREQKLTQSTAGLNVRFQQTVHILQTHKPKSSSMYSHIHKSLRLHPSVSFRQTSDTQTTKRSRCFQQGSHILPVESLHSSQSTLARPQDELMILKTADQAQNMLFSSVSPNLGHQRRTLKFNVEQYLRV